MLTTAHAKRLLFITFVYMGMQLGDKYKIGDIVKEKGELN